MAGCPWWHSGNIWQASCGSMSSSMSSSSSAFCMVDCLELHEASGNSSVAVQHNQIINYQLRPQMYKKIFNDSIWNQYDSIWFNDHPNKKATKVLQQQAVAGLGGPNHHLTVEHFELTRIWPSSCRVLDVGFWTFQTHEVMQSNVATSWRDVERVTISRSFKSRWNVKTCET